MSSSSSGTELRAAFVVVGGGIAGVSCAEALAVLRPDDPVLLLSASAVVKAATNVQPLTKYLVKFEVEEQTGEALTARCPTVQVVHDTVASLRPGGVGRLGGVILTAGGRRVTYTRGVCLCSGARPKPFVANHPHVLTLRDTESVRALQARLAAARRVLVVGNGGIATELVHEARDVEVVWVVRQEHISAALVDAGAAQFFLTAEEQGLDGVGGGGQEAGPVLKRMRYAELSAADAASKTGGGAALGPDWHALWELRGRRAGRSVRVEYGCEVARVLPADDSWPVNVELTNGVLVGADLVVSATGVVPNVEAFVEGNPALRVDAEDGGILVDEHMRTSLPGVFAAGDVCSAGWTHAKHWFQMRLWTQARQMGAYAARCMAADDVREVLQDFCFEMFSHVTRLFGFKVVLLGLYDGQKLEPGSWEVMLRAVKGKEYVKLVLEGGKVQGAVIVGDTDLEETFENLILDQVDVSHLGEDLLNPHVDVEDYFD